MNLLKFSVIAFLSMSVQVYASSPATEQTARYFDSIQTKPTELLAFLTVMPKGGDLHSHESGATFDENLFKYAAKDAVCINPTTYSAYIDSSCDQANLLSTYIKSPASYDAILDAWSMHDYNYQHGIGHNHFFDTFGKFSAIANLHRGEILAEIMQRAALQNESYLELMVTADANESGTLGKKLGWNPDFSVMRNNLLANGLNQAVQDVTTNLNQDEQTMQAKLACQSDHPQLGCGVKVRYLYQVLREQVPEAVFAQLLAGFEAASKDPRVVGINMVQPEDGTISMRDYALHMQMVGYLRSVYPNVHVSLHAGELTSELVPQAGLSFHIHDAVDVAHADRIGHGVDIMQENDATTLLSTMANNHVAVEINLGSNADILGISGKSHPLSTYMQYNVPVVLSTDDEGVSREDLTLQYMRAMDTYSFTYPELKNVVRNSISYAFIAGQNLWADTSYHVANAACAKDVLGANHPSRTCAAFLMLNEKANLQWDLEKRFNSFERTVAKGNNIN